MRESIIAVWFKIPLASRTVTIPAGSYSVRASSTQRAIVTINAGVNTGSNTISSVTTTRATQSGTGRAATAPSGLMTAQIASATTVDHVRDETTSASRAATEVVEFV